MSYWSFDEAEKQHYEALPVYERFVEDARKNSYNYGRAMARAMKSYYLLRRLCETEALPEGVEVDPDSYPGDMSFRFTQLPNEPETWKPFYARLRREDWTRKSNATVEKSSMVIVLEKEGIILNFIVSFPECKVELIRTEKMTVEKPIYKIVCEGSQLVDPEPQEEPIQPEPIQPEPVSDSVPVSTDPDNDIPF